MKVDVIITAGGISSRYGKTNKLLEKINGKEVIKYSTEIFLNLELVNKVIICANCSIIDNIKTMFGINNKLKIIEGGKTRQESVYNGLKNVTSNYVLIHDGARPVITKELIYKVINDVQTKQALTVATKTTDTIKIVDGNKIIKTLNRDLLYNIQTPQAFKTEIIKNAHEKLKGKSFSDDAGMIEELNIPVYILENDYKNLKITTKNDLDIAKIFLKE